MNNKQAKRVGVMWPKAYMYNSELRKPSDEKGPLFLFKKLTHLVFATEELANSCGQGLVQKKKQQLQDKSPLVPEKVSVCKGMQNSRFVKYELIT